MRGKDYILIGLLFLLGFMVVYVVLSLLRRNSPLQNKPKDMANKEQEWSINSGKWAYSKEATPFRVDSRQPRSFGLILAAGLGVLCLALSLSVGILGHPIDLIPRSILSLFGLPAATTSSMGTAVEN
jgi:hypothetical protein